MPPRVQLIPVPALLLLELVAALAPVGATIPEEDLRSISDHMTKLQVGRLTHLELVELARADEEIGGTTSAGVTSAVEF